MARPALQFAVVDGHRAASVHDASARERQAEEQEREQVSACTRTFQPGPSRRASDPTSVGTH